MDFLSNLISGLSLGSIYALIALGYTVYHCIAQGYQCVYTAKAQPADKVGKEVHNLHSGLKIYSPGGSIPPGFCVLYF